jgi:hypothetical protein
MTSATPLSVLRSIRDAQSVSLADITAALEIAEQQILPPETASILSERDTCMINIATRAAFAHRMYKQFAYLGDDKMYEALDEMYDILDEFEKLDFGDVVP